MWKLPHSRKTKMVDFLIGLMEIHGVERSTGPAHVDTEEHTGGGGGGGLAAKLKEKLHLGHH